MNERELFLLLDEAAIDGDETVRRLYAAAGEPPLLLRAARGLCEATKDGGNVFIITGFILAPFNKPETDGLVSAVLLAKVLASALGASPVVICSGECVGMLGKMLGSVGARAEIEPMGKNSAECALRGEELIRRYKPKAAVAVECPAADEKGVYHNAGGLDVTALEAKCDIVFDLCRDSGVFNIAIGDRGNEAGMGGIAQSVRKFVPHGDIIAAAGQADNLLLGRTSDFACYALTAAICFLTDTAMFSQDEHMRVLNEAVSNGAIDMSGRAIPAVDGISAERIAGVTEIMRAAIKKAEPS